MGSRLRGNDEKGRGNDGLMAANSAQGLWATRNCERQ